LCRLCSRVHWLAIETVTELAFCMINYNSQGMKAPFFHGNKVRILLHVAAWTILLGLPLYFVNRWNIGKDFIWFYYINITINGIIFYGNYLLLIPKFFFSTRRYRYYLATILFMIGLYFVSDVSNDLAFKYTLSQRQSDQVDRGPAVRPEDRGNERPRGEEPDRRPIFGMLRVTNYSFTNLFITIFALGLRILERNAQIEKRQKELEKEKLNSELAFLKNQISPHFFFNTLNNIYSLISINAEDSQNAVLKLSRMMRYLLYESEHGETSLSSEIEFMNNYIDLMRLRMSDKVKLTVSFPDNQEDISIPPLLFISIIENAFKHGISYREKSFIDINMEVTPEMITFRCTNSIVKPVDKTTAEHSGIGLENVSKRLNLLFPDRHEFIIDQTASAFDVVVKVKIRKT
jgi:two-component system, LytTR family, sensor kinase